MVTIFDFSQIQFTTNLVGYLRSGQLNGLKICFTIRSILLNSDVETAAKFFLTNWINYLEWNGTPLTLRNLRKNDFTSKIISLLLDILVSEDSYLETYEVIHRIKHFVK